MESGNTKKEAGGGQKGIKDEYEERQQGQNINEN
jgi:hypothetical protein